MMPFYSPFPCYQPFIGHNLYLYPPMVSCQYKSYNKPTQQVTKQEYLPVQDKIQHKQFQFLGNIRLDLNQLENEGYQVTKTLWSEGQDKLLLLSVQTQHLNWKQISKLLPGRNPKMCYNRHKRLSQKKKTLWSNQEDDKLKYLVQQGRIKWKDLENLFLNRKAKQLRQRYLNFLRSNLSRKPWTLQQDLKLIQCVNQIGKRWKKIEKILTHRSQNQIKNRYYGRIQHILKKKEKPSRGQIA